MMSKPDLLVCWIANNDYPLFRLWLEKYHSFFNKIIIHWDIMFRFPFYNAFIQSSLSHIPNIKFLDMAKREFGVDDWRNVATNEMLKHSDSEWVCSIEQDWFDKDWDKTLGLVTEAMGRADLIGWYNQTNFPYIHPAFWFVKREILDKTNKDFAPHMEINGADHFAMVTKEVLEQGGKLITLKDLGLESDNLDPTVVHCFHLGGVNQNYLDFADRFKANSLHRPDIFYVYNHFSMQAPVKQSEEFMMQCREVAAFLKNMFPNIDPETSEWRKFFKIW